MGAPELPDPGEEDLRPTEPIQHPVISDDSDNESEDAYDGYQPLAIDENMDEPVEEDVSEQIETEVAFPNLTPIERVEVAITRQVWNAPRPQENQIELDTTRTAQLVVSLINGITIEYKAINSRAEINLIILSAMANFTLPNATIPEWAVNVPEEHWKEELLQRIRHHKEAQGNETNKAAMESNEMQN